MSRVEVGSPPRAWGQPILLAVLVRSGRFTPTGVGTTDLAGSGWLCRAVHPHGRGDNVLLYLSALWVLGSPPRAWGQLKRGREGRFSPRFTPTGVGTTVALVAWSAAAPVHPHGRGDNRHPNSPAHVHAGSPPRAWGQRPAGEDRRRGTRFTPTGVGTTRWQWHPRSCGPVHPHGRGDNGTRLLGNVADLGSPPRAWGQPGGANRIGAPGRFTPTGVGTTALIDSINDAWAVHPHGRGDNSSGSARLSRPCGSPPRAWGQLGLVRSGLRVVRFTPTGVGTTR